MTNNFVKRINRVSRVPGLLPVAEDMNDGQLSINIADGIIYLRLLSGDIIRVAADISDFVTQLQLQQSISGIDLSAYALAENVAESLLELGQQLQNLVELIEGKASIEHGHEISEIAQLGATLSAMQAAIDGKQPSGNYQPAGSYAPQLHGHGISEIAQLGATLSAMQAAIDGKQAALVAGRDYPIVSDSPPSNPQAKWQWRQIDASNRAIDWVWNGTYWLSAQKFHFSVNSLNGSSGTLTFAFAGHSDNRLILLDEFITSSTFAQAMSPAGGSGAVSSNTNFWTFTLMRFESVASSNFTNSISTQGMTSTVNTPIGQRLSLTNSTVLDMRDYSGASNGKYRGLSLFAAKTGTNSLTLNSLFAGLSYRWIYTP